MKVIPIITNGNNGNKDIYSYLLIDDIHKVGVAIDPSEPFKLYKFIPKDIKISSIFTTHYHINGNNQFKEIFKEIKVYGADERIEGITNILNDNDIIKIGSLLIKAFKTPAHTNGDALFYVFDEYNLKQGGILFTGDILLGGGCGRLFEGKPLQMYHALYDIIGKLPNETKVYCGHEYTLKNLKFALTLEKDNKDLIKYYKKVEKLIENQKPTVPSTIGLEKKINPFMRCDKPSIYNHYLIKYNSQDSINPPSPIDVLGYIRNLKDNF